MSGYEMPLLPGAVWWTLEDDWTDEFAEKWARLAPSMAELLSGESLDAPRDSASLRAVAYERPAAYSPAIFNDPTGDADYCLVSAGAVDDDVAKAARQTLTFAALDLGIDSPALHWFLSADSGRGEFRGTPTIDGLAVRSHSAIAIRADLSPADAVHVAAHEAWHVAADSSDEDGADAYASEIARLLTHESASGRRLVGALHFAEGYPNNRTLAGVAEHGDVLVADRAAYKNFRSSRNPDWCRLRDLGAAV